MKMKSRAGAIMGAVGWTLLFLLSQMAASGIGAAILSMTAAGSGGAVSPELMMAQVSKNISALSMAGSALFLLIVLFSRKGRGLWRGWRVSPGKAALPLAAIVLFASAWNVALASLPLDGNLLGNTAAMGEAAAAQPLLYLLAVYVAAPVAEEVAFRGIVQGGLRRVMSAPAAIACGALLFGLAHVMTGSLLTILFACLGGAVFGLTYEKTGALLLAILVHGVGNLCDFASAFAGALPPTVQGAWIILGLAGAVWAVVRLTRCPGGTR